MIDRQWYPARGAQRRVQALINRGWSRSRLAAQLHVTPRVLDLLLGARRVSPAAHDAVAALFDRLWDQSPPANTHAERAESAAAMAEAHARGWLPPMAWDDLDTDPSPPLTLVDTDTIDQVAIDKAMRGELVRLTDAERRHAFALLFEEGVSASRIAVLLHLGTLTARIEYDALAAAAAPGLHLSVAA